MNFRTSLILSVVAKGVSSSLTIYVVYLRHLGPELNPFTSPAAQAWGMTFVVAFYALLFAQKRLFDRRLKAGAEVRWTKSLESAYIAALYVFPVLFWADALSDTLVSLAALHLF